MSRRRLKTVGLAFALAVSFFVSPKSLSAGWLGVKNNLSQPVILHVIEKKTNARPSVQRLYPGEVTWVWVDSGTKQRVAIQETQAGRKVLVDGDVGIGKLDLLYEAVSKHGVAELSKLWEGTRQKDTAKKP